MWLRKVSPQVPCFRAVPSYKRLNEFTCMGVTFSRTAFIDTTSAGSLVLEDTILDNRILGFSHSVLTVSKGGLVSFGYDYNMTRLLCGRGCEMELVNFTIKLKTKQDCSISLTMLRFNCRACLPGLYSLQRGQRRGLQVVPGFQSCLQCPYGGNCSRSIVAKRNFWGHVLETDPPSLSFYLCPLGYCSPPMYRSTQQEYNGCQGNRTGTLCGKCKEGYTESLYSSHCKPVHLCKDAWFWPLAFLFISTMALYLITKPPVFTLLSRHIMWFKNSQGEGQQDQKSFDRGYTKIVFYFYQTADLLLVYSSPSDLLQTYYILPIIGLLNFQQTLTGPGTTLCVFSGLTVVTKQLFYVSHVVGTLGMICVFFGIRYGVSKIRGQRAPSFDPYLGAIVEVLLLGYSRVVFVTFRLLGCLPIASKRRLFLDGNVACFQPWQYLVVAFVVIFVVPFVFVLTWGSSNFYKKAISAKMFLLSCVFPFPFLLRWTLSCCSSQKHNAEDNQQDFKSLQRVLYEPFRISEDSQWVMSWESVLISRRFILVVLHAVVTDPVTRLLLLTFSSVLFLLHHNVWQPYRDPKANLAETVSLLSLVALAIVNVFFAMFPTLGVVAKGPLLPKLAFCAWLEVVILGLLPSLFVLALLMILMSQGVRALLWGLKSIATCWELCILGRNIKETQPLVVHPHLNDSVEQKK